MPRINSVYGNRGRGTGEDGCIFHENMGIGFKMPDNTVYVLHSQQGEAFGIRDWGNNDLFTGEEDGDVAKGPDERTIRYSVGFLRTVETYYGTDRMCFSISSGNIF